MGQQLALFAGAKTNYPNTLPGRPGKRSRKCQLGWPNCSHDTSVGQFLQGCWDTRQILFHDADESLYYEQIAGRRYMITRRLGTGEFSEVYEAHKMNSAGRREKYAIKVYKSRITERQKQMKEELTILAKLGSYCSQIVRLHQHSQSIDDETGLMELKLVLDLCLGGTLRQRMKKQQSPMTEKIVRIIALQITQALHYLHTRRVMHCDVKPENILFVDPISLNVKLSDFGVAKMSLDGMSHSRAATSFNTTDVYVAPEVLSSQSYGAQADMWSLGITLYHCLTGRLPFQKGSSLNMDVCEEILSGSFISKALSSTQFPEHLSFDALRFLERLLRVDPHDRMNVIEALNHRWLRGHAPENRSALKPQPEQKPECVRRPLSHQKSAVPYAASFDYLPSTNCPSPLSRRFTQQENSAQHSLQPTVSASPSWYMNSKTSAAAPTAYSPLHNRSMTSTTIGQRFTTTSITATTTATGGPIESQDNYKAYPCPIPQRDSSFTPEMFLY